MHLNSLDPDFYLDPNQIKDTLPETYQIYFNQDPQRILDKSMTTKNSWIFPLIHTKARNRSDKDVSTFRSLRCGLFMNGCIENYSNM